MDELLLTGIIGILSIILLITGYLLINRHEKRCWKVDRNTRIVLHLLQTLLDQKELVMLESELHKDPHSNKLPSELLYGIPTDDEDKYLNICTFDTLLCYLALFEQVAVILARDKDLNNLFLNIFSEQIDDLYDNINIFEFIFEHEDKYPELRKLLMNWKDTK